MTQTTTQDRPAVPVGMAIGQAVGQAQAVLSRLLADVLASSGTPRETYLALQRLSAHGDAARREAFVQDLSGSLGLDLWSAGELSDSLAGAGLATLAGGTVRLAPAGAELRERTGQAVGEATERLWAQFDPADLETTVRTLQAVSAAARALLANGGR